MPFRRTDGPRLYGRKWGKFRAAFLAEHPLCRLCEARGRTTAASLVDHVDPHRGDVERFWNNEFQALCATCHNSVKKRQEEGGYLVGCDVDGWPVDPNHFWNKTRIN